ncbi:hypothetical protein Tco_1308031 [Tanacetum coccineum]
MPDPKHPPSPDYVPGPEEPEQAPLSPVFVLEPEYLEYLVPSDDEATIEDQPLPADASSTALLPGDDDDDSSDDVDDNDDDQEEEQEAPEEDEEEEHLAPADSTTLPASDIVPSAEDTEALETDESAPTPPPPRLRRTWMYKVGESSTVAATRQPELDVTTIDATPEHPMSKERVTDLATTLARDTHEIYVRLEDAQDNRALQMGRVNMLFRDRQFHRHTAVLLDSKARHAREAWSHSMNYIKAVHAELQEYRVQTLEAREPELARDPEPQDGPADAGSSSQGIVDALVEHDANRSRNGDDSHDSGTGLRRQVPVTRECTYTDFLKCQPFNFKGTERVVGLTQWFEKMETIGHEVAYAMTWKTLKKMMTHKYCPRGEIKKLEIKLCAEL